MSARVALVSSERGLRLDPDLPLAVAALGGVGVAADRVRWDDDRVGWAGYDLVVVRSCWDYSWRREEFLRWAARVPRLRNAVEVLEWNTDKRYLRGLETAGVPVVPTAWDPATIEQLPEAAEWVVKPAVSAGSRNTARWPDRATALAHVADLRAAGRTAMVQPYLSGVEAEGETALLFLGGGFSHAVRKGPLLAAGEGVRQDRDSRGDLRPTRATADQFDLAHAVLALVERYFGAAPLYARVDLVPGEDGEPVLLELELTEPSLFLPQAPDAAATFARAVLAAVGAQPGV